jgi:hypothetical protein
MSGAARTREVVGQNVAAAALDEAHNRGCCHHGQKRGQLAEQRLSGREMVYRVD